MPGFRRALAGPALLPALAGTALGLVLLNFVTLGGTDPVWIGWRAGNVLLVTMPALAAAAFAEASRWAPRVRRMATAIALGAGLIGVPTTAVDAFNAQDTGNRNRGPGYMWTLQVSPEQQAAFDWIRTWTPRRAVVQMEPTGRGRDGWSLIPTFAQRSMAAGLPISLVLQPYHRHRARIVRRIYDTLDAQWAWREARDLRIDYLYVDRTDRRGIRAAALEKFDQSPQHFQPLFRQGDVAIYAVLR